MSFTLCRRRRLERVSFYEGKNGQSEVHFMQERKAGDRFNLFRSEGVEKGSVYEQVSFRHESKDTERLIIGASQKRDRLPIYA